MEGLAATLAGVNTYDANQNTVKHYYAKQEQKRKQTQKKKRGTNG